MGEANLVQRAPTTAEFVARHPWEKEWLERGEPLEFLWHFELAARPEEVWPFVSDTSRLNRSMGVSRMHFEERDGVLHGHAVNGGFLQEWVEVPWGWVAERSMTSVRIYSRGFAHVVRAIFELVPLGDRTRFDVYFGWVPRGFWQRIILRLGMAPLEKQFARALSEAERQASEQRTSLVPFSAAPSALGPETEQHLEELARQLLLDDVPKNIVDRLVRHVRQTDEMDLWRIQVLPLARRWKIDADQLLGAFLKATRRGLFALSWDVICPHCRGVRAEARTLGEVPRKGDCAVCAIDFETAEENAIEVTFHVHPSIRQVERQFFCSAEPAFKAHVRVQQRVEAGHTLEVETALGSGHYRLRIAGEKTHHALEIGEDMESDQLVWQAGEAPPAGTRPNPSLVLRARPDAACTFVVEIPSWSDDALRPSRLFSFQEFRDLFTEEYVGSDVQLSVGSQTILFTDVVGSTKLYVTRGDPGAFVDVKRHFTEIYDVVRRHHGAIVKTIGDAAMAAFARPVDALAAARDIQLCFPPGRDDLGLRVRVSLNAGPCIAVNLNTNIDYFGNTVNLAAKLQACAEAGQVAFPKSVADQPGVRELLESSGAVLVELTHRTAGLEVRTEVLRWDVNP